MEGSCSPKPELQGKCGWAGEVVVRSPEWAQPAKGSPGLTRIMDGVGESTMTSGQRKRPSG